MLWYHWDTRPFNCPTWVYQEDNTNNMAQTSFKTHQKIRKFYNKIVYYQSKHDDLITTFEYSENCHRFHPKIEEVDNLPRIHHVQPMLSTPRKQTSRKCPKIRKNHKISLWQRCLTLSNIPLINWASTWGEKSKHSRRRLRKYSDFILPCLNHNWRLHPCYKMSVTRGWFTDTLGQIFPLLVEIWLWIQLVDASRL
jgi:hypothetical protein